jgi:hypothetical protein
MHKSALWTGKRGLIHRKKDPGTSPQGIYKSGKTGGSRQYVDVK